MNYYYLCLSKKIKQMCNGIIPRMVSEIKNYEAVACWVLYSLRLFQSVLYYSWPVMSLVFCFIFPHCHVFQMLWFSKVIIS